MKNVKKSLALLISTMMVLATLAACGGPKEPTPESSTTPGTDATPVAAGEFKDYSKGFEKQVTIKIPVYDRAFEGWNVSDNFYTKWIQKEFGDKYNVKVEYVGIGRSTEVADFMSMLADGSAPSIIFNYDMPQAVHYYNEGAMHHLNIQEIANYAPNYWANMGEINKTYGEMDSKNYFFFAEREPIYYNNVTLIRQDGLDKVGAIMPTNLDEYNEVLKKWKEAGLGVKGEILENKSFDFDYAFRGASVDPKELALYSDLNVAPLTWNSTKEYLKNLNYQYNNGLVDPEFYMVEDDASWKAKFVAGKVGTYQYYISSSTDVISSLMANDPNAKVATLDIIATVPAGSHPYYYQNLPFGMIMGINNKATEEERAAVWMFLEWMNEPANLFYLQNGVEGQNYNMADGIAVPVKDFAGESKRSNNNNKDYWCLAAEVAHYETEELSFKANRTNLAPAGFEYLVDDAYKYSLRDAQYGLINTIYTKPIASSAEYAADLNALWQELYVKIATCKPEKFEEEYTNACKEYLAAGYQEIIDEKQKLLDEGSFK